MKCILIEIPFGLSLVLPPAAATFLTSAQFVETEGYAENRKTFKSARSIEAIFIDPQSISDRADIIPETPVPPRLITDDDIPF